MICMKVNRLPYGKHEGMNKFFIFAPPRSRTAWLANFLTYGDSFCWHEGTVFRSVKNMFDGMDYLAVGNSDSTNPFFIDEILEHNPKLVVIQNEFKNVKSSLESIGLWNKAGERLLYKSFENIEKIKQLNPLIVHFHEIDKKAAEIWDYCTDLPLNQKRLEQLLIFNIEVVLEKKMSQMRKTCLLHG